MNGQTSPQAGRPQAYEELLMLCLLSCPTNREYDIFIGGIGNNITKPAETTATQFIVIEDIACSAYLGGALQVRINTTDYFQNPDVTDQAGVPGLASPYPRGSSDSAVTDPN